MMDFLKYLKYWLFEPAAKHCKPLMAEHTWRAPSKREKFPVCINCGKSCWWLRGYTLNSGTRLNADHEAIKLMADNDRRLNGVAWNSAP